MTVASELALRLCQARASWGVSAVPFTEALIAHPRWLASPYPDDLFTAWCAARGVTPAIDEVARRITTLTLSQKRARVSEDTLEEARQRLLERMLVPSGEQPAKIATYEGSGPLDGWLRVSLAREALALDRKTAREQVWDELLAPVEETTPEAQYLRRLYETTYKRAFEEAARALSARERSILRQHLVLGLSIDRLGDLYGVHRVTASRWILSAREALLTNTRRNLERELSLSRRDLEGLARLVESRLDLSLERILETDSSLER